MCCLHTKTAWIRFRHSGKADSSEPGVSARLVPARPGLACAEVLEASANLGLSALASILERKEMGAFDWLVLDFLTLNLCGRSCVITRYLDHVTSKQELCGRQIYAFRPGQRRDSE